MKIYAIEYTVLDDNKTKYYVYIDKFLSTRQEIPKQFFDQLSEVFFIPHKNNHSYQATFFDSI